MADQELNEKLSTLLAKSGLNDKAAFAALYDITKSKLFAVSLRIVRERHIAEEALQDSFVNIWNNAGHYAVAKSAPMTWMSAIVRNRSLDIMRRPRLEIQDEEEYFTLNLEDERLGPQDQLTQGRDAAQVEICLKGLEADQRQTISLAFFHGLSHSELSTHLKKPLGTIKTHIRRGLMKLKDCLDDHVNYQPEDGERT